MEVGDDHSITSEVGKQEHETPARPRSAGLALCLALLTPGIGHLYAGAWKRALVFLLGYIVLLPLCLFLFLEVKSDWISLIPLLVLVGFQLWIPIDAAISAKKANLSADTKHFATPSLCGLSLLMIIGFYSYFLTIRTHVGQAYKIPSEAMRETLLVGDHVIADKYSYRLHDPERGDVVVFLFPPDPSKTYVKRIIGVPGDHIEILRPLVKVNGKVLDEPYAIYRVEPMSAPPKTDFVVPRGQYVVLGDDRDKSEDSRYWGYLPRSLIIGRMRRVYFSWNTTEYDTRMASESTWMAIIEFLRTIRWERSGKEIH